jgi:hypothetical protein
MSMMIALLLTLFLTPAAAVSRDESTVVNEMARITVKYDHGAIRIVRVERVPLGSPERMRRWRGRFEARAVTAGKTVDFVRFDFPLMAEAEAPEDTTAEAAKVGQKLREHVTTATTLVRTPLPAGATSVAVYDTVTKKSTSADLPAAAAGGAGGTKR